MLLEFITAFKKKIQHSLNLSEMHFHDSSDWVAIGV